jgi:hypothetical protein
MGECPVVSNGDKNNGAGQGREISDFDEAYAAWLMVF